MEVGFSILGKFLGVCAVVFRFRKDGRGGRERRDAGEIAVGENVEKAVGETRRAGRRRTVQQVDVVRRKLCRVKGFRFERKEADFLRDERDGDFLRRVVVGVRRFRRVVKRLFDKAFRCFFVALSSRRLDEKEAGEEIIGGVASLVGVFLSNV